MLGSIWPLLLTVAPTFTELSSKPHEAGAALLDRHLDLTSPDNLIVDADIGGVGVRAGLYIPICLIFLTLTFGFFVTEENGAKELGGAQLLSTLSMKL